ncbi:MFS general substrate transporter [Durotheca rogersii]|uniref:MFS general substrate transporter n=1 Tax=Durotheca rogersii TaxID=419775 RepID=UPI002220ABD3|nr:MFS general substrate transporter [Durotheca rogersii]KAI5867982.1 MFS general substrate transporter [Durotheca rogersii]
MTRVPVIEARRGSEVKFGSDNTDGVQTETDVKVAASASAADPDIDPSPDSVPDDEPPEGGLVAWSQVASAHIANMLSWGYGTGFSVFQLYYKQNMHWPNAQVAWIGSVQIFFLFLLGMVSGRLSDAGYMVHSYAGGALLTVIGMFMTSVSTQYVHIMLAQGVCMGIGGGLMFMPATANVTTYFKKKRSVAVAFSGCGSSTGAILFPAIIQYLTPQVGFPWAVRICGFTSVFLAVVGLLILTQRKLQRVPAPFFDLAAFKYTPYTTFCVGAFLMYFGLFTLLIYINSFAREIIGFSDLQSVNFVFVTNAVAIPARPIFGIIADRYLGAVTTFGCNTVALGVMAFSWIGVTSGSAMYAYSVVMGFVNGAAQGIVSSAVSSFVKDVAKMGTWMGMVFGLGGFATLAGPPAMGAIIDASGGSYLWGQVWAGTLIVTGGVTVLVSARLLGGPPKTGFWPRV